MERPIILFLSSTSLHFPLDLHGILANEGAETKRYESIDDFLSTPDRHTPYVAVLEIGSTEDIDRALLAYEWCEQIQPIAPCRTILLLASKNIQLGDRAARFGNAEVAHLPLPLKNLLFKLDLQKRLLAADQARAAAERGKEPARVGGFSASFVERPPKLDRVLLIRGPEPKKGYWQEAGESPSGKIRWRWVSTQKPEEQSPAEKAGVTWAADSRVKPVYEEENQAWAIEDPEADLLGFRKDKPIFSARTSLRLPPVERVDGEKREFGAEKTGHEADRAFSQAAKTEASRTVAEKPAAAPSSQTVQRAEGKTPKTAEKFAPEPAPTAAARAFQAAAPAASSRQQFPSGGAEAAPSAVPTRAAANAPEGKSPPPSAAAARPAETRAPAPATPAAAPAERAERAAAPAEEAPLAQPGEAPIPEHVQEAEPEDNSGYSVPVSSGAEGKTAGQPSAAAGEAYSPRAAGHPRKEAEYSSSAGAKPQPASTGEESITERKARRRAEAEAAAAQAQRSFEQETAQAAKIRPERTAAAAPEKPTGPHEPAARAGAVPARDEAAGVTVPANPAAPVSDTRLPSADESPHAEEVTRAAGQITAPAKEEIKIQGDAVDERIETEVALEGTPEHRGEEIRIRARAEGDSPHGQRPAKRPGENPLQYRHFVTMTLAELSDRDSSWHPMHRYRIYLSANHRYYGVKDPAALLPLWVYEGELAPEFLEDKRAWKFYDRYPELYSTLDTLPPVVLDQIHVMAGKPLGSLAGSPVTGGGVSEGRGNSITLPAAENEVTPEPSQGLWGSVKSFFRKLLGR